MAGTDCSRDRLLWFRQKLTHLRALRNGPDESASTATARPPILLAVSPSNRVIRQYMHRIFLSSAAALLVAATPVAAHVVVRPAVTLFERNVDRGPVEATRSAAVPLGRFAVVSCVSEPWGIFPATFAAGSSGVARHGRIRFGVALRPGPDSMP
jgi:hypothetical protein